MDERARCMARQGHAFATADEVRVVLQTESDVLEDVPADGKTLGEIVTRGNIVMKEVRRFHMIPTNKALELTLVNYHSTTMILKRHAKLSEGVVSELGTLLSCTQMGLWQSWIEARISSSPGERTPQVFLSNKVSQPPHQESHMLVSNKLKKKRRTRLASPRPRS